MGDIGRERLGIRLYYGDGRRHAYRVADLVGGCWQQIQPVCHDLDAVPAADLVTQLYVLAHPTDMLDPHQHSSLGAEFDACPRCGRQLRALPHEILAGTDIVAVHGCLDLPAPRRGTTACPSAPVHAGT
jgi:hypothetical protein